MKTKKLLRRAETNLQSEGLIKFWNTGARSIRKPLEVEISAAKANGRVSKKEAKDRWRMQHELKM